MLALVATHGRAPFEAVLGRHAQAVQAHADEDALAKRHVHQRVERLRVGRVLPRFAVGGSRATAAIAHADPAAVAPRDAPQNVFAGNFRELAPHESVGRSAHKRLRAAHAAGIAADAEKHAIAEAQAAQILHVFRLFLERLPHRAIRGDRENIVPAVTADRDKAPQTRRDGAVSFALLAELKILPVSAVFRNEPLTIVTDGDEEGGHGGLGEG